MRRDSAEKVTQKRPHVRRVLAGVAASPVSITCILLVGILGTVIAASGDGARIPMAATARSFPEHWWVLLTSAFWARNPTSSLIGILLLLSIGVLVERRIGSRQFAVAAVTGQVAGVAAAMGFVAVSASVMGDWVGQISGNVFAGPTALVFAALMASTASMTTLWRRRIRVGVFALLLLLALYNGGFADLVRLLSATVGALMGPLLSGRRPRTPHPVSSRHERRVLIALLVAATAIGPVVAGLAPHAVGPLSVLRYLLTNIQPVDPETLQKLCAYPALARDCAAAALQLRAGAGGTFMAVLPSFLLLLFADGLRRGRRAAWAGTLLIQAALSAIAVATIIAVLQPAAVDTAASEGISAGDSAAHGHPLALVLPLLLPLLLAVLLLSRRKLFTVRAPRGTYRRLAFFIAGLAAVLAVTYAGAAMAMAQDFSPAPGPGGILADIPDRFLPLGYMFDLAPAFVPLSPRAVVLYEGVGIVFWAVTGAALLRTFLRPAHNVHSLDEDRARAIIKMQDGGTLSWMTTWPGNRYWFSPGGRSFVAYRVIGGIALTLGPPVGPRGDVEKTFDEFTAHCTANGWSPCFYSVPGQLQIHATARGWAGVQVAQETILDLEHVTFKGKKFQDIRTSMNNAAKAGVRAEWTTYAGAPRTVQAQIQEISEEWVEDKSIPEMGFTLGSLDELDDPEVRCLVAIDRDKKVHAVTSWLPVYRNGAIIGWTLDLIRRRGTALRGSAEFLIASAAITLRDESYEFISLSGAPLAPPRQDDRSKEPAPTSNAMDRLLEGLGATLEPVYGFRSLLGFKSKFQPRYVPLYMVYPDPAALPAIGRAVTRAYLPEVGFEQGLSLTRTLLRSVLSRIGRRGISQR
ncbi:bifunctional lysylphosphatidylglycerol flippase/synthetase MprF [Paenarthrobacter sp. NPDC089675]|uniref:bifunctional lysylphosphatidylglycerol flippase/synthetase MprF n=1 Tax=Paenarthrobacter sp. NPDC089675 TaxID=3364376 RepID=UPI00380293E5